MFQNACSNKGVYAWRCLQWEEAWIKAFSILQNVDPFPCLCWLSEIIADATVQWHVNYAPLWSGTSANALQANKAPWNPASYNLLLGKLKLAVTH